MLLEGTRERKNFTSRMCCVEVGCCVLVHELIWLRRFRVHSYSIKLSSIWMMNRAMLLSQGVSATTTHLSLYNSVKIPRLGLGTFRSRGDEVRAAVLWALKKGYMLIDTASIYKNEVEIGHAVRESGIPREQLFITSKISPFEQGYESALQAVTSILERLDCGYLDLCLVHWPGVAKLAVNSEKHRVLRRETWRALEDMYNESKCRSIGVSNYTERHLEELLGSCKVRPMVNQVELHPYLTQLSLRQYCADKAIVVQAYAPLGVGNLLDDPVVVAIAARQKRTPAQILLRWGIQHDLVVLPKSVKKDRIEENAGVFCFVLLEEDMIRLDSLGRDQRFCWSPQEVL